MVAVKLLTVFDSEASEQPSPSESKSLLFTLPSASVSQVLTCVPINTLSMPISSTVAPKLNPIVLEFVNTVLGTETMILVDGTFVVTILMLDTFTVAPFLATTLAVVPPFGFVMVA